MSSSAYSETFQFIGKGKAYLGPYGGGSGRTFAGLVTSLEIGAEIETKELFDYTQGGGGVYDSLNRVKSMTCKIDFREMQPRNVAAMTAGYESEVATASVTNEEHVAYKGGLAAFAYPLKATATITGSSNVTDGWTAATAYAAGDYIIPTTPNTHVYKCTVAGTSATPTEPTWPTNGTTVVDGTATWKDMGVPAFVSGTDFLVAGCGVIPTLSGGIPDGMPTKWTYSKANAWDVQLLTSTGADWSLTVDGLNEAISDRGVVLDLYRIKFSPAGLALIGDDYWTGQANGQVLKDSTKNASSTISGYGRWIYKKSA